MPLSRKQLRLYDAKLQCTQRQGIRVLKKKINNKSQKMKSNTKYEITSPTFCINTEQPERWKSRKESP
jgi:hypothetical protein